MALCFLTETICLETMNKHRDKKQVYLPFQIGGRFC